MSMKRKQESDAQKPSPNVPDPNKKLKTSKESHAEQRNLAKERKAAKPNADSIARAKTLWGRLRLKSHVPVEERTQLVAELFSIVTGNVKDFVFKHDSVRTVQCAVKYANLEQKKEIARELKGQYTTLAESRYAKFLVAKLIVEDKDIKGMIVSEFYGHVKRLINHPEASWILDDTYRGVASPTQKAILLREWYGPEFAIFKDNDTSKSSKDAVSADLPTILAHNPEKRKPIMSHLFNMINQLIQKKLHGFTMLHDAMLQYSLADSTNADGTTTTISTEFLDLIKPTEEGDEDLLKNLAFTTSGSRLICRVLALTAAKDRKQILRAFKDSVPTLARDPNGVKVLLAACEVVDDTILSSKLIFPPLVPPTTTPEEERLNALEDLITDPVGRIALLYPFTAAIAPAKGVRSSDTWLLPPSSPLNPIIAELRALRTTTSKKDPTTRRHELQTALLKQSSYALTSLISARASTLMTTPSGYQLITEVLLSAPTLLEDDAGASSGIQSAMAAVAQTASGDPLSEGHPAQQPAAGRMLKTLALGAPYRVVNAENGDDNATRQQQKKNALFAELLWEQIKEHVVGWAAGPSSFVVANLLENDVFEGRKDVKVALKGKKAQKELVEAKDKGNKGAALCLDLAGK